jgi:hypothetical protein
MFYHRILFFSQIRIWTIVKWAQFLPLECLHVLIRCANPSIWYSLTHELVSTLLEHTLHVVPHVFTLQAESSLQFQNQAIAKLGASGIKLWKRMTEKLTQKLLHTAPLSGPICHVGCKSIVIPANGRRDGATAPSDLARLVHTDKVT